MRLKSGQRILVDEKCDKPDEPVLWLKYLQGTKKMHKYIFRAGALTYLILAILALVFYLERTAFLDIAFHLFYILKDGSFAIQNNRYGAFMTQLFPLVGSKAGLSLSSVMKLYSVGFVVYYFAIFFLITRVLKSYRFGLGMVLFSTLMVSETFYWIQSELPQGLAFMILYFAAVYSMPQNEGYKKWYLYPVLATMIVTLIFFHPLLVFPFLFCSIFMYVEHRDLRDFLKGGLVFYLLLLVVKSLFFKTEYDSNAIGGVRNFIALFPDYLFLPSNKQFLLDIMRKYYLLLIVFLAMLYIYIRQGKLAKAFLIAAFFVGYTLLVNVSYPNGAASFYIENLYLPLSIFVVIPFALDFSMNNQKHYFVLIALILGIRIAHIGFSHKGYTERLNWLKHYLDDTKNLEQKKLIASENHFPMDTLLMSWATPYEFWLLSTVSEGESRSVMITDNVSEVEWAIPYNKKFVTKWGVFDYAELPAKYFTLTDTSFYKLLK